MASLGSIVPVTDASDGGFDACFGQSFGVFYRQILPATVRVMDQSAPMGRAAVMDGLFQSIEHKCRVRGAAGAPTDDAAGEDINNEGHANEACPSRDVSKIARHCPRTNGGQ